MRDIQILIVVQEFDDVARLRGVDDRGGDELIHRLMIARMGRIVDEPGATDVDGAGEESHAEGFVVGDSLEGAD